MGERDKAGSWSTTRRLNQVPYLAIRLSAGNMDIALPLITGYGDSICKRFNSIPSRMGKREGANH